MLRLATPVRCKIVESGKICGGKHYGHGMCSKHYTRWRRYGNPLGFATRPTLEDRFWVKVDERGPDECWPWTGTITPAGYGQIGIGQRLDFAHRVSYRLLVGLIPDGMEIDHLCHTRDETCRLGDECPHRRCVNPAHLEPVTGLENSMRSRSPHAENARKTHCPQDHEYTAENTYVSPNGSRHCRECIKDQEQVKREAQARRVLLGLPQPEPVKSHCPAKHPYSGDNLGVYPDGTPRCRACSREQAAERRRKARMKSAA